MATITEQPTRKTIEEKLVRYSFKENPTIHAFSKSTKFIRGLMGPFGSGKSSGCLMDIVNKGKLQRPNSAGIRRVRWGVVRNTYQQLRDTTLKTVTDWFPPSHFGVLHGGEKGPWNYYLKLPTLNLEAELLFRALDRPDQVSNLLSLELTGAWLNEYREIPIPIFEAIQGRVGRFPSERDGGCDWHGVIMDTNPPPEGSEYEIFFEKQRPDNAVLFKQPSGLSPEAENLAHLPGGRNYYANLAKGKDRDYVRVYIEGKYGFILTGEAVTPEYNEDIHRSKKPLPVIEHAMGVRFYDGGLNPTCIVGQITPAGQLYIHRTFRGKNIGMKQLIASEVKPFLGQHFKSVKRWRDIGDPALRSKDQGNSDVSAAKEIEEGLNTFLEPGPVKWAPRREALKSGLNLMVSGKPWVFLDPRDEILHQCLRGGWHYKRNSDGQIVNTDPVKDEHSHPGDAFAYGLAVLQDIAGRTAEEERALQSQAREEDMVFAGGVW